MDSSMSRVPMPIRVSSEMKAALEAKAAEQSRNVTSLIDSIFLEWFEKQPERFLIPGSKITYKDTKNNKYNAIIEEKKIDDSPEKGRISIFFVPPISNNNGSSSVRALVFPDSITKGWSDKPAN